VFFCPALDTVLHGLDLLVEITLDAQKTFTGEQEGFTVRSDAAGYISVIKEKMSLQG